MTTAESEEAMSPEAARDRLVWIALALARAAPWGQSPDWDALKSAVQDLHDASALAPEPPVVSQRERIARAMWAEWWEYPTAWENGSEPERAKFLTMADAARLAALHAVRDAYGGNPSDPAWDTPEGIAGIIEELSGIVRTEAAKSALRDYRADTVYEDTGGVLASEIAKHVSAPNEP